MPRGKNFLNDIIKRAPFRSPMIGKLAKELEPVLGNAAEPLLPLPSLTWLKQVVSLVDAQVLEYQEAVLATVDAGDKGIIAFDHTFKHST
jgi:hypothetical protein